MHCKQPYCYPAVVVSVLKWLINSWMSKKDLRRVILSKIDHNAALFVCNSNSNLRLQPVRKLIRSILICIIINCCSPQLRLMFNLVSLEMCVVMSIIKTCWHLVSTTTTQSHTFQRQIQIKFSIKCIYLFITGTSEIYIHIYTRLMQRRNKIMTGEETCVPLRCLRSVLLY